MLSVTMLIFGISTSLLLLGVWGRAVTTDQGTVAKSAQAVVDADAATDRIYDWIEDSISGSQFAGADEADAMVTEIRKRPEVSRAINDVIGAFVGALLAPEDGSAVIDLEAAIGPAVPAIADGLTRSGLPIDEASLALALDDASAIRLDTNGAGKYVTVIHTARALVSRVVVLASLTMMLAAGVALLIANERAVMLRTLAQRVLFSALSFAALFRLGSWALDPSGGGSPIASGGSILLGSNGEVFVVIAIIAAAVSGLGAWMVRRRRKRYNMIDLTVEGFPVRSGGVADDDTRELIWV